MLLLSTPVWVLMTVVSGLALLVLEPSGAARTFGVSALAVMVLAGIATGLAEAKRGPRDSTAAGLSPTPQDGPTGTHAGAGGAGTDPAAASSTQAEVAEPGPGDERAEPSPPAGHVRVLRAGEPLPS